MKKFGTLLVFALLSACSTASDEGRNVQVVFLNPKPVQPPTAEEIHEQRINMFLDRAHFVGTVGITVDPHHYSTIDTVPVHVAARGQPLGAQLRDQPFIEEFMRLDQALMQQPPPMIHKPPASPTRLANGPLFSLDRQFDFMAALPGCARPTRVMGSLTGMGSRRLANLMMPERKMAVVLSIDDPKFALGDLLDGSGFLPSLLGLVVCS